jgi:hypothetical protein
MKDSCYSYIERFDKDNYRVIIVSVSEDGRERTRTKLFRSIIEATKYKELYDVGSSYNEERP